MRRIRCVPAALTAPSMPTSARLGAKGLSGLIPPPAPLAHHAFRFSQGALAAHAPGSTGAFVHTFNGRTNVAQYLRTGVWGRYTDRLFLWGLGSPPRPAPQPRRPRLHLRPSRVAGP